MFVKINNNEYLRRLLESKKIELESIEVDHKIVIEHNTKKKIIIALIHSIERQLNNS